MTKRSMTYDLDGIFASRNQGQLISSEVAQRKMIRTPGLVPIRTSPAWKNSPRRTRPMLRSQTHGMGDITLPVVGAVSTTTALLGAAGIGVIAFLLYKNAKR